MHEFADLLKSKEPAMRSIAASFMRPERLVKITLACVSRTPALQNCTQESIIRSAMQSAELGLEPGSALGESYLVPFKEQCQLIIGYRGLISLAYRSGHILSIQSKEVYAGEEFEFELGLEPKLRHIPGSGPRDPKTITHVYCVVRLKDGGVVSDCMTREEVERIRGRSRAGSSGPWVTDFAEMAKKTVCRRALKYCPMSIEMSKAISADDTADTGTDYTGEFDSVDAEYTIEAEQEQDRSHGTEAVKERLTDTDRAAAPDPSVKLRAECTGIIGEHNLKGDPVRAAAKSAGITNGLWENCTDPELLEKFKITLQQYAETESK